MKKLTSILIAAALMLSVAGCASGGEAPAPAESAAPAAESTAEAAPAAAAQTEIRVLNYLDMSGSGAMEELDVVWKAFDAAHPEIKVTREDQFNDPFHNAVEAYAAAGTLPDVIYVWPSGRSTTLHTKKLLKDLQPLVDRDGLASQYNPLALDGKSQAGGYLAMLPQGITATHAFYVNNDVLAKAGLTPAKTYSELVAQVPVLKAAGFDTICMPNKDTWVMQSCLFSMLAGRFMGEGWDQKILNGEMDFNSPDFIATLDFVKKLYTDGVLPQSSLALDYGEAPGLFATDTAAYYIDGDWRVGAFITDKTTNQALIAPDKQKNIGITVFPEIDVPGVKFNRSNSAVLGTGWGINANLADGSPELEAAWTLTKWLVGKEVQTFRLRTGGISTPSINGIDVASLPLEPMQITMAGFSKEYDKSTVVIDGVFEGPVYTPLNDGLQALGLGTQTSQQVAGLTQDAFVAWKATK